MGSGCDPCNNNPIHYNNPFKPKSDNCGCFDASQIIYTGVDLPCTGVTTNTKLEEILIAIDAQICSVVGDYSSYNFHCLSNDYEINTEAEFVSAITEEFCNLKSSYNTFVSSTYPTGIQNLQNQINQINSPGLTLCTYSGVISTDTYVNIITKLANKLCDLNSRLDISTVIWDNCFTVVTPPVTIPQGFQLLADQICQVASSIVQPELPTFNNQGSCLPTPGTADTLVATIGKIKTRLCQSSVYDIDSSPWGCIVNPDPGTGANIQSAFDAILPILNDLYGNRYEFDTNQFNVTPNGGACDGFTITLDPSVGIEDRLVAATSTDTNPGTLQDKLEAGTNITFDYSDPEKAVINSTFTDQNVKVNVSDPSSGYLANKVTGATDPSGIQIQTSVVSNQVQIAPVVNLPSLTENILTTIQNDVDLYNIFCNLMCGCVPCADTTSTTTMDTRTQLRVYFVNQDLTNGVNLNVVLNQNNPTVGFIDNGYIIPANSTSDSGFYLMTTLSSPKTVNLSLSNPDFGTLNYQVDVVVTQGFGGPTVPGSTTFSTATLDTYNNPTFNVGSLSGDIVIRITISNVIPA